MDLDKAFVAAILIAGIDGLKAAQGKGVSADLLHDEGRRAYDFTIDYFQTYNGFPSFDAVEGKLGITLADPGSPLEFLADEIINRQLHTKLSSTYQDGVKHLEMNDPQAALAVTETALYELRRDQLTAARVVPFATLGDAAIDFYRKVKAGERGILTPWDNLNDATFGFWPEDFVLFVARTGVGKTWTALILAHYAWTQGHKVLFVSTEMAQLGMGIRWAALHNQLSYYEFRHGMLSTADEIKLVEGVEEAKKVPGFDVVGGDFDFQIETLDVAIAEAKPDLVVADGANLFKSEGGSRTESAANSFDEFKRVAKRRSVPVLLTTQFNREVKSGAKAGSMKAEKIALSDAAGWNADQIYALYQTEEMRADKRMGFHPMKCREGVVEDWEIRWDLDRMQFEQIAAQGGSSDADDDFSTGVGADPGAVKDTDDAPF